MKNNKVRNMTAIAIFGALAGILYAMLRFNIPGFPMFLEINFSDVPALISGFAYGPFVGSMVQVVKVLIKIVISPTSTSYVGELSDLLLGVAIVLPTAIFYKKNRTFKGAIIGTLIGVFSHLFLALLINKFILIPFYVKLFSLEKVASMCLGLDVYGWDLIFFGILPFNAIKDVIVVILVFLIYKPLFKIINATAKRMQKD